MSAEMPLTWLLAPAVQIVFGWPSTNRRASIHAPEMASAIKRYIHNGQWIA